MIIDEAYCEFNLLDDPDASIELLDRHPNLVLLRTFSKVYGLCGLRVGFALCGSEELPRAVDQVRQPFFCNALAQAAAVEALAHQDAVTERVTCTIAERLSVDERLRALGLDPAISQANFCWFALGDARDEAEVMRGLEERGVLVRGGGALGRERLRCASPTAPPRKTRASWRRSPRCFSSSGETVRADRRQEPSCGPLCTTVSQKRLSYLLQLCSDGHFRARIFASSSRVFVVVLRLAIYLGASAVPARERAPQPHRVPSSGPSAFPACTTPSLTRHST